MCRSVLFCDYLRLFLCNKIWEKIIEGEGKQEENRSNVERKLVEYGIGW